MKKRTPRRPSSPRPRVRIRCKARSIWPQILDRRLDEAGVRAYRQEGELKATTAELGTRNRTSRNSRSCSGSSGPIVPPVKLLQRGPKVRLDTESYKDGPLLYAS